MNKEEIKNIIDRYEKLNKKQQDDVIRVLNKKIKYYEDINVKEKCNLNGHDYEEWVEKKEIWSRICKKCGYKEIKNKEFFEIFSEKIKIENLDETIKALRKRINMQDK